MNTTQNKINDIKEESLAFVNTKTFKRNMSFLSINNS